jgi:hypothetical protein
MRGFPFAVARCFWLNGGRCDPAHPASVCLISFRVGEMTISGSFANWQPGQAGLKVYVFTGRGHPERYGFGMGGLPELAMGHPDGSQSIFRFQLAWSQMVVLVLTDRDHVEILDLKNDVNHLARVALDALGFVWAAGLDLEIVSCVDPSGTAHVFNTAFDGLRGEEGPDRERREHEMLNRLIEQGHRSSNVRLALADLRNAIREPADTCVNCYRAVESIRQEYRGEGPESQTARRRSWDRLREILDVEEPELRWLEDLATPRRHGEAVDVTHADRERALRLARRVVEQHCLRIQAGA